MTNGSGVTVDPLQTIRNVSWGGPVCLITVTGLGVDFVVVKAKDPPSPLPVLPFPVQGQPSDTIDPNTYKNMNMATLVGNNPNSDTPPIVPAQGCWFGYVIGPGEPPTPNQGTRISDIPIGTHNLSQAEFFIQDFIDPVPAQNNSIYYLIDFTLVQTMKVTQAVADDFTYQLMSAVLGGPSPPYVEYCAENPSAVGVESILLSTTVDPYAVPIYDGEHPSFSQYETQTDLPSSTFPTTTKIQMYSGGLFIRDGTAELTDDLLWQEYPVGPSGGALLWEAELSELGASLTFTATGPQ